MPIWAEWWAWFSAALALVTLEVILPGYIFLGFAVGASIVGLVLLIGLAGLGLPWLLVIFAVCSGVAYLAMRRFFGLKGGQVKIWERDINDDP